MGGEWGKHLYRLPRRSRRSSVVIDQIVDFCRQKTQRPTVFYSKEDPVDRRGFLGAAERFDFVFTTDEGSIPYYERKLGHRRVACLPFAAQPRIHNPDSASEKRDGNVFFAGTWYAKRHRERRRQAESILRPALDYGLEILDRVEHRADPDYAWPLEYQTAIIGTLPYTRMLAANKHYRVGLNLNSVTKSSTMCSRRIFELLASGTPVVSSPSAAISNFFGEDLVLVSETPSETRAHLEKLLTEDAYRERLAVQGVESVYADHTYAQRLNQLLAVVGVI
jgi:spore maturation protein CgeB